MLRWMHASPGSLQLHVAKTGGANSLLHDGAARTSQIGALLSIKTDTAYNEYFMRLVPAASDTLIFAEERYRFSQTGFLPEEAPWTNLGSGHRESRLSSEADVDTTARTILQLFRDLRTYHFHDTSDTARIKTRWNVEDSRFLKEYGANLAPFLYRLRESQPAYYRRIVETIRQAAPFFGDFILQPQNDTILLQWSEVGSDLQFGPHQASMAA
jgi:hypothetical protein